MKEGATLDSNGNAVVSSMKKSSMGNDKKNVKFSGNIDDDHEGDW